MRGISPRRGSQDGQWSLLRSAWREGEGLTVRLGRATGNPNAGHQRKRQRRPTKHLAGDFSEQVATICPAYKVERPSTLSLPISTVVLPVRKEESLVLGYSVSHPPMAVPRSGAQRQGQRECANPGPPETLL